MDQRPFGRTTALRRPPKRAESGGFPPLGNLALRIVSLALCAALAAASARAALPSGYLEFEYIQGNGSDARIVTDYTPTPKQDKIEAVVSFPTGTLNKNQAIWCARGTGGQDRTWTLFALKDSSDNKYRFRFDTVVPGAVHTFDLERQFDGRPLSVNLAKSVVDFLDTHLKGGKP